MCALVKAPEEKWGKMGANGEKLGGHEETKPVHPSPTIFSIRPPPTQDTPFTPISPSFHPRAPHFPRFPFSIECSS